MARLVVIILIVSSFAPRLGSQQTAATPQTDPQALTVLAQMIAATGWDPTAIPVDVLAIGTVTIPGDSSGPESSQRVNLKAKGLNQFSFESGQPTKRSVVNTGGASATIGAKQVRLPARVFDAWHFPFLSRIIFFADPSIQVQYLGIEQVGEPTYKVKLSREPAPNDPARDEIRAGSPVTVWVSCSTFLPVQVEYKKPTITNRLAFIPRTAKYSDYRQVGNKLVPFRHEEWYQGELIYTLKFSNVSFNNGLLDTDFFVP